MFCHYIQHKNVSVRNGVLDVLLVVLRKAVWVRDSWVKSTDLSVRYTPAQRAWLLESFTDILTKVGVPNLCFVFSCH